MLKLISLFFISIFIVSCGGDVGTVYHNGANSSGSSNGSSGTGGSNSGSGGSTSGNTNNNNSNTVKLACLPGTDCSNHKPPVDKGSAISCLPGMECVSSEIKVDESKKNDTNSTTSTDKSKSCGVLPGQERC